MRCFARAILITAILLAVTGAQGQIFWQPMRSGIQSTLYADFSYSGAGDLEWRGRDFGSTDTWHARVNYTALWSPHERFSWGLGPAWSYHAFGVADELPLPDDAQSLALRLALNWRFADRWMLRTDVRPGLYSDFADISSDDFNAPFFIAGGYQFSTNLIVVAGLNVNFRSELATIGGPGLWWRFADRWTLNLLLPKPTIEYSPTRALDLYVGGGIEGGGWRVSEHLGSDHGAPAIDNDSLGYRELRAGAGVRYRFGPLLRLSLEGGYTLDRRFEYRDSDETFDLENAPYLEFTISGRF